jgi:hypothetical protein
MSFKAIRAGAGWTPRDAALPWPGSHRRSRGMGPPHGTGHRRRRLRTGATVEQLSRSAAERRFRRFVLVLSVAGWVLLAVLVRTASGRDQALAAGALACFTPLVYFLASYALS